MIEMRKSWIKKSDNGSFTFIDLFAGIGGFRIALESHGGQCIFSSEWDKNSQQTYSRNHGDIPHGDITKIDEKDIPKHDVLCGGFPCQAFSISGKQKGFEDTRGTLFFDVARIVSYHKPKVLFLENVKNLVRHRGGETFIHMKEILEGLGYNVFFKVLRSSDYGVPQARERVYIIGFRNDLSITEFDFPAQKGKPKIIKEILESNVSDKYTIKRDDINLYGVDRIVKDNRRPLQIGIINKGGQGERIYSIDSVGITLSAHGGGAASKTGAYLVNGVIRKLTPRECARVQGYPEDFEIPVTDGIAYKQFGDSVSMPVLKEIFQKVIEYYPSIYRKEIPEAELRKEEVKLF